MRKTAIIFTVILSGVILSLPACKKTESTDNTPSLQGLTINEAVPYVAVGDELVFNAVTSALSVSNGTKPSVIGLYWQVNSAKKDTLSRDVRTENPQFKYRVDTLGTYQIACYAFATGFYNSSVITSFKAIDPITSLTGTDLTPIANIDGKDWTAYNMTDPDSGTSYKDADVVDTIFGRFFTWEEAQNICPDGWHLPSAAEWDALGNEAGALMAPAKFLDNRMWEPALGQEITNNTGFNAIPVGYLDTTASRDRFRRFGEMAAFWTSSDSASDPNLAQYRFILYDNPEIMKGNGSKTSLALSVRCVKD